MLQGQPKKHHEGQGAEKEERRDRRPTSGPFPYSLEGWSSTGMNGLPLEEPLELFGERQGGRVALLRVLLEAFEANDLEVARHVAPKSRRRRRLFARGLPDRLVRGVGTERNAAGEKLVENHSEAINISRRRRCALLPQGLLRGDVACSPA